MLFDSRARDFEVHAMKKGYTEQRPRGRAQRLGIERAGRTLQKNRAGRAESFGGTDDRTGVAGILQTVEHHHQSAAIEQLRHPPLWRFDQCDHSLAGLRTGDFLQQRVRQDGQPYAAECGQPVARRFRGQHLFHRTPAAQRLFQQVDGLRHAPSLRRQATAREGPPDILD
jgi:hypothetical protein